MANGKNPTVQNKNHRRQKIVKVKLNFSWKNLLIYAFLFLFAMFIFTGINNNQSFKSTKTIPLSQVVLDVKENKVTEIEVLENKLVLTEGKETFQSFKEAGANVYQIFKDAGVELNKTKITIKDETGFNNWLNIISSVLPILLMVAFFYFIFRQARGAQESIFSFGKSSAKLFSKDTPKTTFKDVAGVDEAKRELTEIVDFLKNPGKYKAMGARTPKGVLMICPSGTGKTLLARATAGEANVHFFSMAGSEFMEMLVGVGASRVRDLFNTAKKAQPAIIFIDEVDAIGRQRGAGFMGGHDEREQTLNQILVEMDGFAPTEQLVVMAATNRPDVLDPALIRPGRFDRRVVLDMPDVVGRKAILAIHARGKPFNKSVDWEKIAKRTVGFSGADIENMLNEAAILAARLLKNTIKIKKEKKTSLLEHISVMLGGRAAENLVFSEMTTGASDDIAKATEVARTMVVEYGMSELGPINLETEQKTFYDQKTISPIMASKIDEQIKKITDSGYKSAVAILAKLRQELDIIAKELLIKETIDADTFVNLLGPKKSLVPAKV